MSREFSSELQDSWYAEKGIDSDVVLSTTMMLKRNLANFAFYPLLKHDDAEKVQAILFDVFTRMGDPDRFQMVTLHSLEEVGQKLLFERGLLPAQYNTFSDCGLVLRTDGKVSCTINAQDHLNILAFNAGLDIEKVYERVSFIDEFMQEYVQFAASEDFGYLTASLSHVGTGRVIFFSLQLQGILFTKKLAELEQLLAEYSLEFEPRYGKIESLGHALGGFYSIYNKNCYEAQDAVFFEKIKEGLDKIITLERNCREQLYEEQPTFIVDLVYRAIAIIKFCRFIGYGECIEYLSLIKLGLNFHIITGINDAEIHALLYRIQNAHLSFVIKTTEFRFEKDVITLEQKITRLRSLVIHEALANVQLVV